MSFKQVLPVLLLSSIFRLLDESCASRRQLWPVIHERTAREVLAKASSNQVRRATLRPIDLMRPIAQLSWSLPQSSVSLLENLGRPTVPTSQHRSGKRRW